MMVKLNKPKYHLIYESIVEGSIYGDDEISDESESNSDDQADQSITNGELNSLIFDDSIFGLFRRFGQGRYSSEKFEETKKSFGFVVNRISSTIEENKNARH